MVQSARAPGLFPSDGEAAGDGARCAEPSDCHVLTDGEFNTPRWLHTFDQVSLVLAPRFVADVVREGLPADRVEFAHSGREATRQLPAIPMRFFQSLRPTLRTAGCTRTR